MVHEVVNVSGRDVAYRRLKRQLAELTVEIQLAPLTTLACQKQLE